MRNAEQKEEAKEQARQEHSQQQARQEHSQQQARAEQANCRQEKNIANCRQEKSIAICRQEKNKEVCEKPKADHEESEKHTEELHTQSVEGYNCDAQDVTMCTPSLKQTAISLSS